MKYIFGIIIVFECVFKINMILNNVCRSSFDKTIFFNLLNKLPSLSKDNHVYSHYFHIVTMNC